MGRATRSLVQLWGNEPWVQHLARREIPTGDPTVDTLLTRYSLSVGSAYTMQNGDVLLTVAPPEPLNIQALAGLFHGITGVRFAEPNNLVGAGNAITDSFHLSPLFLHYY